MNLVLLFFGLVYICAILLGIVLLFGSIVACICNRRKLAGGLVLGLIPIAAIIFALDAMMGDDAVRKPVTRGELAGTYQAEQGGGKYLNRMGYKDLTGQINLNSEGGFTATRIPACCIHGNDENKLPFSGGYYRLDGTWTVEENDYGAQKVKLNIRTAELSDQPPNSNAKLLADRRFQSSSLDVGLRNGTPIYLALSIWEGSDFNYIYFQRKNFDVLRHQRKKG